MRASAMGDDSSRIVVLRKLEQELGGELDAGRLAQIESIFFVSSNTQTFASSRAKEAFKNRWLGRYLDHFRDEFLVAMDHQGRIIGYLAGCLQDPARQPLFADIGYFAALADLTARYPAHLHINIDPRWRSRGIGARLIEAFCRHARAAGAPGVHVVTGASARNARFYARCGFHELRHVNWHGEQLCLGRSLDT